MNNINYIDLVIEKKLKNQHAKMYMRFTMFRPAGYQESYHFPIPMNCLSFQLSFKKEKSRRFLISKPFREWTKPNRPGR